MKFQLLGTNADNNFVTYQPKITVSVRPFEYCSIETKTKAIRTAPDEIPHFPFFKWKPS